MPNMDGLTLLKELKKQPATKFTPVIMLTTESEVPSKKDQGRLAARRLGPGETVCAQIKCWRR
ncbi:hypothetical protein ACT691_02500 [Vibrio metschnikovii]